MYLALALLSLAVASPLAQDDWLAESSQLIEQGAAVDAVGMIEEHLDSSPESAAGWRALGNALEQMWRQGAANFLIVDDARAAWMRAVDLEPFDVDTLHGAANVHMLLGEHEPAAAMAIRALGTCRVEGREAPAGMTEMICRARVGAFDAREHADDDEWARDVRSVWQTITGTRELDPQNSGLAAVEANFLNSLGLPDLALDSLATSLETIRSDAGLYGILGDIHARGGVEDRLPALYSSLGVLGMNGTLAWYTGFAHRLVADTARRERRFDEARVSYERAIEWMQTTKVLEPGFAAGADAVRFQAEVSIGWCLLGTRDFDAAEARLMPLLGETDAVRNASDGLGRTAMSGISKLSSSLAALRQYGRAADVARAVVAVTPEDGSWWNNLGFLLREYGTQVENGSYPDVPNEPRITHPIFAESWSAYQRAIELQPEDASFANDGAIMQVYHLRDELELAEEFLHAAVRMGNAQLAEMEEDVAESERFPIAQVVGDAYENLGYLYYHVLDRAAESRAFWVASMESDSGDRSYFQVYVDAIDGTHEPVEERDNSFLKGPLKKANPRARIGWESSLNEAMVRADDEGRPLVVYNRGAATNIEIIYVDVRVRSEGFRARTDGAVHVIADSLRHNFVDRTRAGRRLPCSKWAPVTCGEHIQAAAEFAAWHLRAYGVEAGEEEEGLWTRGADEILHPAELPIALDATGVENTIDLDALASSQSFGPLVALRRQAARDMVERLLFEGSSDVSAEVAGALREDGQLTSVALINAAIEQIGNAPLGLTALAAWPGGDTTALERAALWSPNDDVRNTAAQLLEIAKDGYDRVALARSIVSD